ncbi:MAG: insulinase family protein [Deltaproteobacteria bacterium]|nr:insulinase family protein [Deltaproteobacteria bacterium]
MGAALERAAVVASREAGVAVSLAGHFRYNDVLMAARFRLANGLTVLLLPDERAQIFAYQTWFRVGSKHEDPEKSGMAHFLEHLMFKGTARHPLGELDREMERRGSQTNAATWVDWTYYVETLATHGDNFATVIDFESDRMTRLILDAQTFESELEVVKNERRMSVDNSPSGALSEALYSAAFTSHPYRRPTIGLMAHLEQMQRDAVEHFYRTYYAPNNATVVVAGALDPTEALVQLAKGYGGLAAQALPAANRIVEPEQREARQVTLTRPVVSPIVVAAFHAPAQLQPDFAALELLSEVLVVGDNARLYRRLVTEDELASDVMGVLVPFAEPGLYEVVVNARPGADVGQIVRVIQEELDHLADGLSAQEVRKARHGLELGLYDGLKDVEGCAEALGHYETNYKDYTLAFTGMDRWSKVEVAKLPEAAARVFSPTNRTVAVVLPGEGGA